MSPNRLRFPRWLKLAYVMVVAAVLGWVLLKAGPGLLQWRSLINAPGAYAFVAAWIAMAVLLGQLWALLLRWSYGVRLGVREWLPVQALAWGGRYLPGKVGLLAGKAALAERENLGWRRLGFSVLVEQLCFVVAGIVAACLFLASVDLLPAHLRAEWLAATWTPFRSLLVVVCILGFLVGVSWLGRRLDAATRLSNARAAALLSFYLLPHLLVGAGAYLALVGLVPAATSIGIYTMIGVVALAHSVGVLAIFAPAGLGVREVVMAAGLASALPLPEALAFATLLRLLSVVADSLFLLMGLAMRRRARAD